ncbi:antibiotic biosynthesis monooxygenase [Herbiconiux sp.]|uniref:putative quinol monooxygenase n=1 Tax=Herbiconiux sp. TaxID=1871186 RepID=UPI0025BB65AF|nr:antibiotic biosynthesis monooxygenase [Herbiconiux sp.]
MTQRDEIYWLVTCAVKPGKFEDFTKVVEPLVAATKAEEGSIAYDYSVNEDETLVHIFESYRDSRAVVSHVTTVFSQFAEGFLEGVDVTGFVVFGSPDAEAKEILDGFGSTYMRPFEGFTRR